MKTKIILFDIDGVIIRPPYYFWKELEKRWYVGAEEILNNFFINENTACTEWKADIRNIILTYLKEVWWEKSIEEFLQEQFEFEAQFFDTNFKNIVKRLHDKNILCYLASAQEKVRADYFLETFDFNNIFDGHYISCDVWYRKDKPEYWEYVIEDLQKRHKGIQLDEIAFFDDGKKNIDLANKFWIQAFLFTNMENFGKDLEVLKITT